MLIFGIFLVLVGIAFFGLGLIIHPNIIDVAVNGSLLFAIIGTLFFITGIILLITNIRQNIKSSRFEKHGTDLYAFIANVSPLFVERFGKKKLKECILEVYIYEIDDSINKQYIRVKKSYTISSGDYGAVRKYNDEYKFIEKIPKSCVLGHVQKAIKEHIEKE